jgi:hypothetical protein
MKRHRSYGLPFVLALVATSAVAAADPPKDARTSPASTQGYSYTFTDDSLLAGPNGVNDIRVNGRLPGMRQTLIRPRTQFIVELLKSVENL